MNISFIEACKSFKKQIKKVVERNANQYRDMYKDMGVNIDKLGCIMIDADGSTIKNIISEEDLYTTSNPDRFWIKGFVAGHTPHVTLLYGLMESGKTTYKKYVDQVLEGWSIDNVEIDHVDFFDSPFKDDPYYCLIAHVVISPELKDGNQRLSLLPHINTFPEYKAHITIAYIKKDETLRDELIGKYNEMLKGETLATKGINYGK